jgi:hypothetical protein
VVAGVQTLQETMNTVMPHTPIAATAHQGPIDWRRLVDWAREDGLITADEARRTVDRCAKAESVQHPLVRLASVSMRRASDDRPLDIESLTQWLASRTGLEYLRIDPLKVDVGKVSETMSAAYAERHRVLPVQVTPTEVVVATAEPFLTDWVAEVERQSRRTVRRVLASPGEIQRYTVEFFALAKSVRAAQKAGGNAGGASFEQLVELGRSNKQLDANDQGVVQVVDWLWQYAFDQRASDIHLEPRREQGTIRFRIDGVLHPVYQMPIGVLNAMTARIKLLGRMDVIEKRRPQDGRIKTRNTRGDEIEMRLSTLPTAFGEKMVMRIFDPDTTVKDLDALGFSAHDAERWEALVKRPHGIVLVTGPTGSGKTTTLYSTLRRLATDAVNVSTVEDPIEMIEPAFNQTQVQPQLDFRLHRRPARADAPGPGHHHGRRNPRPQDRRDGGPGGADRAHGVQHPAHQRRAQRDHARHGTRRAALPDQRHGAGRAGPAPGAHPVPAVQGEGRKRHPRRSGSRGQALEDQWRLPALQGGGLRGLPHDRLHGPHGPVRAVDRVRGLQGPGQPAAQHRRPAPPGRGRRHAPAAPCRRPACGRGADHARRGLVGNTACGLRVPLVLTLSCRRCQGRFIRLRR